MAAKQPAHMFGVNTFFSPVHRYIRLKHITLCCKRTAIRDNQCQSSTILQGHGQHTMHSADALHFPLLLQL